jgi:hypothetical protein
MADTGRSISILEGADQRKPAGSASAQRPWIGVRFLCAGAYVRVGRSPDGSSYNAMCPRCGKRVRFRVGPGGTSSRYFEVAC